jgi:hypothetical protein
VSPPHLPINGTRKASKASRTTPLTTTHSRPRQPSLSAGHPLQPYSRESSLGHLWDLRRPFAAPHPLRGPKETVLNIIIHLTPGKLTSKHQLYDAYLDGNWLLTSHDPEPAVCRELARRGYCGRVEFRWGDRLGLIVRDLHAFAKLATRENNRKGPLMATYSPHMFMPADTYRTTAEVEWASPLEASGFSR